MSHVEQFIHREVVPGACEPTDRVLLEESAGLLLYNRLYMPVTADYSYLGVVSDRQESMIAAMLLQLDTTEAKIIALGVRSSHDENHGLGAALLAAALASDHIETPASFMLYPTASSVTFYANLGFVSLNKTTAEAGMRAETPVLQQKLQHRRLVGRLAELQHTF